MSPNRQCDWQKQEWFALIHTHRIECLQCGGKWGRAELTALVTPTPMIRMPASLMLWTTPGSWSTSRVGFPSVIRIMRFDASGRSQWATVNTSFCVSRSAPVVFVLPPQYGSRRTWATSKSLFVKLHKYTYTEASFPEINQTKQNHSYRRLDVALHTLKSRQVREKNFTKGYYGNVWTAIADVQSEDDVGDKIND